jgi:hypothetical protein
MASQSWELNLRTSTCAPLFAIAFCYSKNFVGNMLIHVILTAVCADLSRDIFYDKGHPVAIKGDRCCALFGFPMFADDALHFIHKNYPFNDTSPAGSGRMHSFFW